jgi:flagellar protein FliO/FliZ
MLPPWSQMAGALAALLAVLALAVLAARVLRWRGIALPQAQQRMRLAASLALDSRRRLHLVECDGQRLVVLSGTTDRIVRLDGAP